MKQELRFFARYAGQEVLVMLGLGTLILVGSRLFSGSSLFGSYLMMYPAFALLFPFTFGVAFRVHVDTALRFGALRSSCFAVVQLLHLAGALCNTALIWLVCGAGRRILPADVLEDRLVLKPTPAILALLLAGGILAAEAGLALGNVTDTRRRRVWMVVGVCAAVLLMMGGTTMLIILADEWVSWLTLHNPAVLALVAGLLAAGAALALVVHRQYRKAVVCV